MPPPPNIPFPQPTNIHDLKILQTITNLSVERCKYLLIQVARLKHCSWREALGYHFAITGKQPKLSEPEAMPAWHLYYARGYGAALYEHERAYLADNEVQLLGPYGS
jgi:hypothetical protein